MYKHYLIIGGVVAVLLLSAGAIVMTQSGKEGGMSTMMGQGVAKLFNAECRYDDPELCKFINNWNMPSEYSMYSIMTGAKSPTIEFESRVDGDDSHTIMKDGGTVTHESINLGGVDYIKDLTDNVWWKIVKEEGVEQPIAEAIEIDYNFTEKMEMVEDKTTYVRIGMEACGKAQCYKYQVIDPENNSTKEFIWFDDEDYLMRKMRSEEQGGAMSVSEITTTYGNITISTPSPVKEGTVLDAYGASAGMSKSDIAEMKKMQADVEEANAEYLKYLENMPEDMSY